MLRRAWGRVHQFFLSAEREALPAADRATVLDAAKSLAAELVRHTREAGGPWALTARELSQAPTLDMVRVAPSLIEGGGFGVFAKQDLPRLTPFCFYPGVFTPAVPPALMYNVDGSIRVTTWDPPDDSRNTEYLLNLSHVGGTIDGIDAPREPAVCAGHVVNHPPPGIVPSVEMIEFMWPEMLPDEPSGAKSPAGNSLASGLWYIDDESGRSVPIPDELPLAGVVFFTLRDVVAGEELYWDYGAKPTKDSSWFSPVDYASLVGSESMYEGSSTSPRKK